MRAVLLAVFLLSAALTATPAAAAGLRSLLDAPGLTGEWGGARKRLWDRGVAPFALYEAGVFANTTGGFRTGTRYEGFLMWGLDLDFERLTGGPAARFHIDWTAYHGGKISEELVGQSGATAVHGSEAERTVRFFRIWAETELAAGRVRLRAGQIVTDDTFFVSRYSGTLMNAAFGIFALGRDESAIPSYPLAAPGLQVEWDAGAGVGLRGGVYTADTGTDDPDSIGFDWGFDEGASFMGEVTLHRKPLGLPGHYTLGFGATTRAVPQFDTGRLVAGSWALYGMLDQALLLGADGRPRLGLFTRFISTMTRDRSVLGDYVDGGLEWHGSIPGRPNDVASLGVIYIRFAQDYVDRQHRAGNNVSTREFSLELTYRIQVNRWLTVQPDVQFFLDPHRSRDNALVVGAMAVIRL